MTSAMDDLLEKNGASFVRVEGNAGPILSPWSPLPPPSSKIIDASIPPVPKNMLPVAMSWNAVRTYSAAA